MLPWDKDRPVPVVARNPATGERVRVDVSEDLRQAIRDAINGTVAENKTALTPPVRVAQEFTERTLLHGAAIDLAVGFAAVLSTFAAPDSALTKALWVITAVLAVKTLLSAAQTFATGKLTK